MRWVASSRYANLSRSTGKQTLRVCKPETAADLDALLSALLGRAQTPSLPVRLGFALSLCEIRLVHSQRHFAQRRIVNLCTPIREALRLIPKPLDGHVLNFLCRPVRLFS
jgi:hypothetical protein